MTLIRRKDSSPTFVDSTEPLHVRLRPTKLDDVMGQPGVVNSLRTLFASNRLPHAFLFTGPSGTGKTTLARIIARMLGCERDAVYELDAARFSGAEAMRELIEGARFAAISANARKCFILEEVQTLSKVAWQTLLLSLEEPPPHVWWALCTTEPDKVPTTIKTRCHAYALASVRWDVLAEYLETIAKSERLQLAEGVLDPLARRAGGSVRQALVYLSTVSGITDKGEALRLLESADAAEGEPVELARMVVTGRGFTWEAVRELLMRLADQSPETLRMVTVNYATTVLLNTKNPQEAERLMAVLQTFSTSCTGADGRSVLLCSIGVLLFGGQT